MNCCDLERAVLLIGDEETVTPVNAPPNPFFPRFMGEKVSRGAGRMRGS